MIITMLKNDKGSVNNGITVNVYGKGNTYEVPNYLGNVFVSRKTARKGNDKDVQESIKKAESEPVEVEEKSMVVETKEDINEQDDLPSKKRGRPAKIEETLEDKDDNDG